MRASGFVAALVGVAVALPAAAQWGHGGRADLRVGQLDHATGGSYWNEKAPFFTGDASGLDDTVMAFDLFRKTAPRSGWMLTVGRFEGEVDQAYRDYAHADGTPIAHTTRLEEWHLTASYVVELGDAMAAVVPYLGAGVGLYSWELSETGEFLDFGVDPPEVFGARYADDGVELGWTAFAGLEVRLGLSTSLLLEVRRHQADAELGADFTGSTSQRLDLGGTEATVGVAWRW